MIAMLVSMVSLTTAFQEAPSPAKSMSMEEVLAATSKAAGVEFISSAELGLGGRVASVPEGYLSGPEAFDRCLTLCRQSNLALLKLKDKDNVWQVLMRDQAYRVGVPVYHSAGELPMRDEFCSLVLGLEHAEPRQVQVALVQLVTNPMGVQPLSKAVVVTDYVSVLRRVAEVAKLMDATAPRALRGEYLITFTLIRAEGETDRLPADLPKELERFRKILDKPTAYGKYERIDSSSVRMYVDPESARPMGSSDPAEPKHLLAGGTDGFRLSFIPLVNPDGSMRLDSVRISPRGSREQEREILSTVLTIREGEAALIGTCKTAQSTWPMIFVVELAPVERP